MIGKLATVAQSLIFASSYASLLIPRPKGPFGTNVAVTALTDTTRLDPFAPKPENLSVVISVFYPAAGTNDCHWKYVPAYPKKVAAILDAEVAFAGVPNGTLERVKFEICETNGGCQTDLLKSPIVFFSPGLGLTRLWYSALAQSVASFGYVVVTVDQPYDADVVEFPDGRIVKAINSTWNQEQSELLVNVTAKDASFVLDELAKSQVVEELFSGHIHPSSLLGLSTDRAGIFGHSIGGATAAMAMFLDPRFAGGIDLDGGLYGPVIQQGLKDPFMLFGHKSNSTSPTFGKFWPHLNWKLDIDIKNATHTTFTDIPLLADLIFGSPLPPLVQEVVGGVPGERARDVITAYVVAFMDMVLKCQPQGLLQRQSAEFPEIEFVPSPKP